MAREKPGLAEWVPAGTLIVKKHAYWGIGGFDEKLKTGEDFDICYRLRRKGYKIFNDPSIASAHIGQTDRLGDFFIKEMWRGNSLIKSIKQHGLLKEELPTTILTFYHLGAITLLIISLFTAKIEFISAMLILLLIPSSFIAVYKTLQTRKMSYLLNFYVMILVYQITRAISLIRYNQFKEVFKISRLKNKVVWITWEKMQA